MQSNSVNEFLFFFSPLVLPIFKKINLNLFGSEYAGVRVMQFLCGSVGWLLAWRDESNNCNLWTNSKSYIKL